MSHSGRRVRAISAAATRPARDRFPGRTRHASTPVGVCNRVAGSRRMTAAAIDWPSVRLHDGSPAPRLLSRLVGVAAKRGPTDGSRDIPPMRGMKSKIPRLWWVRVALRAVATRWELFGARAHRDRRGSTPPEIRAVASGGDRGRNLAGRAVAHGAVPRMGVTAGGGTATTTTGPGESR